MSKALNQIELGTSCVIKETGQPGTLQRIFYYPTKYLIKSENGEFNYYNTHEISFEGYDRSSTTLNIPEVPHNGVGEKLASWIPFEAVSLVEHHFLSSKEILWEMLTSLETYNLWFTGIQRAIADVKSDRYVHKFSFDQLPLKPGSYFKIRPATLAPWFRCRIITVEKKKNLVLTLECLRSLVNIYRSRLKNLKQEFLLHVPELVKVFSHFYHFIIGIKINQKF